MRFAAGAPKSPRPLPDWLLEAALYSLALRQAPRRARVWIGASRRRRGTVVVTAVVTGLLVFPGWLGAVATAQSGSSTSTAANSALSWMNVRDSAGVNLSAYMFATDHGSVLHPVSTGLALVLSLEFAGWMVIVTTGVWLVGYVLSFRWLDLFAAPLRGMSRALAGELAVPVVLVTAASIGAFFVAWFVLRGYHTKAAMQVMTMIGVAVLGPVFLSDPLSEVLSADGWLAQGRDVGLSVAAGLNGNSHTQPTQLVSSMQEQLADGFARRPLQVWNFGHVIDDRPACRAVWSAGIAAGDEDRVKDGMRGCGDAAAYAAASNPGVGQIGAGLLLLLAGTLLLAFAVVLAIKIVWSALDSIYHGLMAIVGFAAGGFVYGPSQTFLMRSVVHGFFAAARMAAEVVFLGLYVLLLGDLFEQAHGQVMSVFVIGAIVEVVAILQLKRLSASLDRGNDWVAGRFAAALQASGAKPGGGGSVAMGAVGARRNGSGALATVTGINAFGNSPVTEWLWGATRTPWRPYARAERRAMLAQYGVWGIPGLGGPNGWHAQNYFARQSYAEAARTAAHAHGGIDTVMGAAAAIQHASDMGAGAADFYPALRGAGFTDEALMSHAVASWNVVAGNASDFVLSDSRLGHTVAAMQRVQNTVHRMVGSGSGFRPGKPGETAADLATLQAAAYRFRRANEGGITLDHGHRQGPQQDYVHSYMSDPTQEKLVALGRLANGDTLKDLSIRDRVTGVWSVAPNSASSEAFHTTELLNAGIDRVAAERMWSWIGNEHAKRIFDSVNDLVADPADAARVHAAQSALVAAQATDRWSPSGMATPWKKLAPPVGAPSHPNWTPAMERVAQLMR